MGVVAPTSLDEACTALADEPEAQLLAGGTDFMVEVNFGHRRPSSVIALGNVADLHGWHGRDGELVLNAGLTYTEMEEEPLASRLPALAQAARTVGSPQIRNAGTIGGNLGTASPAGDTLPVLIALDAVVSLRSASHRRDLPLAEFITGPKRHALAPGEVIAHVRVPRLRGPQEFLKVGTRNAMVIAVASVAIVVDLDGRTVRCGLGSVGPVPLRSTEAEAWVAAEIDWDAGRIDDPRSYETFGHMVAEAARPIDDHRSTAAYRRHAIGVCARRALMRAFP
ncbi:MAG: FAD binding domain-containing protein [Acidimicrobiales bacterium]